MLDLVVPYAFPSICGFAALWFCYAQFVKPFLSPLRKIPGCPYRPFIGNLLEAKREGANNNGIRWMLKYRSRIIRFYFFGGEGAVLTGDANVARYILVTNSKNYVRSPSSFLTKLVPDFLAMISGDKHHALRRILNPTFNSHSIENFIPVFEALSRNIATRWLATLGESRGTILVTAQNDMTCLTLDAICECGFGYKMNAIGDRQRPEVQSFKRMMGSLQLSYLRLLGLNWWPSKKNRQFKEDFKVFQTVIKDVIDAKLNLMDMGGSSRDILTQLLQATDENGKHLSKSMLYSHVGGFLFAGYETTSMALTFSLIELAKDMKLQDRARQEVLTVLPPNSNQSFTQEMVEKLKFLDCVIKESLRMHTPFSTIFRRAVKDDYLNKYFIPAGTLVGINLGAMHRLPELWNDPLTFKPERFLEDYDKSCFLPFGSGPYMCIGQQFAMTEAKIVLAIILRYFRITLPEDYEYKVIRKLVLQPDPPLRLLASRLIV